MSIFIFAKSVSALNIRFEDPRSFLGRELPDRKAPLKKMWTCKKGLVAAALAFYRGKGDRHPGRPLDLFKSPRTCGFIFSAPVPSSSSCICFL